MFVILPGSSAPTLSLTPSVRIGIDTNSNINASDDIACCRREETGGIEVVCRNRNIVLDRDRELACSRTGNGVAILVGRRNDRREIDRRNADCVAGDMRSWKPASPLPATWSS